MIVKVSEIRSVFENLLNGTVSREEADRWAYSVIQESEKGNLTFIPASEQEKIWAGIMYLYGVDVKDRPEVYLHTIEDIRAAMEEKFGN